MMNNLIQLMAAALGSVAFGLVFNVRKKYLPVSALLGLICWGAWLLTQTGNPNGVFIPSLQSGLVTAIAAEIASRVLRAPSTVFFLTATIPLIPGSTLYNCMNALVESRMHDALHYGLRTLFVACGIAVGMCIAWAICDFSRKVNRRFRSAK